MNEKKNINEAFSQNGHNKTLQLFNYTFFSVKTKLDRVEIPGKQSLRDLGFQDLITSSQLITKYNNEKIMEKNPTNKSHLI